MLSRALSRRVPHVAPNLRRVLSSTAAPPSDSPNHRSILSLDGDTIRPYVQPNAFVAPSASVIGSVTANDHSSIMYGSVVRGDLALIHIGAYSSVQENCTLTAGRVEGALSPAEAVATGLSIEPELFVGDFCTIGPNSTLSSCHLEGQNVIGAGSSINAGARIGYSSAIAPRSVVAPDAEIPDGELWAGNPAEKVRDLTAEEIAANKAAAEGNSMTKTAHMYEFLPGGFGYLEKEKLKTAVAS